MTKEKFCKYAGITENQFNGIEEIKEIGELTQDQFGNVSFREFFKLG